MTIDLKTGKPFPRGARPSPRHKLAAAMPYRMVSAPPAQFAGLATQLSEWGNSTYGDCVSAEEAEAKASWSQGYCGLPELFVPEDTIVSWARQHGFLNGADLGEVLDAMAKYGIDVNGQHYVDGPKQSVDYSNEQILQSAIATGPVKIAIAADALGSGAGNTMGWYAFGNKHDNNTDHCVGLRAYGPASFLYKAMGVALPSGVDPNKTGYILYTWKTYGMVDHDWLMGTCSEAWVRTPTTPGQSPVPPVPPTPPTPPVVPIMSLDFTRGGYGPNQTVTFYTGPYTIPPIKVNLVPVVSKAEGPVTAGEPV